MYLTIDRNSGVPVSAQIIDQIKYQVISGVLAGGERIPSVRGLAKQLKLNPTTVARVYQQLEAEEIIYTQPGRGTFIAAERPAYTAAEKRRRLTPLVRKLIVEAGRVGMEFEALRELVDREIERIDPGESTEE